MHEVLVNRLGGLSLPRKSVLRLTDRPDMTLDVYRGRKNNKSINPREAPWSSCKSSSAIAQKVAVSREFEAGLRHAATGNLSLKPSSK